MYLEYIEFNSGWRPPTYRHLDIRRVKKLFETESKNGHAYTVFLGEISDEDASYLKIKDPNVKFRNFRPR